MSIFKPTMSITRFKVSGLPEKDGIDIIQNMIDRFTVGQIVDMELGEDIVWGWTKMIDPYIPMFNDVSFMTGDYVTVGLRIDKKSVPAAVVKKEVYLAVKKELEEKQLPKIGRAQKLLIKESVIKNLLAKAPAVPASYDIIWNVEDKIIYLFSTQKLAREVLEEVIKESFGLSVAMIFPFVMGLNDVDESIMSSIQPTNFA